MTNQEIISKVLSADVVRDELYEFYAEIHITRRKHPELYEIFKSAIDNNQDDLLHDLLLACFPKVGVDPSWVDSAEADWEVNEDEVWVWEKLIARGK